MTLPKWNPPTYETDAEGTQREVSSGGYSDMPTLQGMSIVPGANVPANHGGALQEARQFKGPDGKIYYGFKQHPNPSISQYYGGNASVLETGDESLDWNLNHGWVIDPGTGQLTTMGTQRDRFNVQTPIQGTWTDPESGAVYYMTQPGGVSMTAPTHDNTNFGLGTFIRDVATGPIGMAIGAGLGPTLFGNSSVGAGLDTSGFGAYDAGAFNAGSAGGSLPSITSSVQNGGSFVPQQQVGGWSTTATGGNMGEWDWLDQALQGNNNGIDFPVNDAGNTTQSWANGDWIDQNVATNNGGITPNWADSGATTAPGVGIDGNTVSAPSGVAGSNVYGNPLDVLKNIYNGSIPLSSLFGSGGGNTSNAGPVQPGTNGNIGNLISALFGYAGQNNLADKLLEASKYATDKADPFASQRGFYQGELQKLYTDPNALMNNSMFTGARDQAMNQAQRMLASKGYSGSGNEALQMMKAGTQAQTQYAIPYLQQTSTNAGASFGPGAAGQIAQTGMTGAAQASNNANGYLGYGLNQLMGGNNNQSSLDQLYGKIGQGVLSNMMGGGSSGSGMRI